MSCWEAGADAWGKLQEPSECGRFQNLMNLLLPNDCGKGFGLKMFSFQEVPPNRLGTSPGEWLGEETIYIFFFNKRI